MTRYFGRLARTAAEIVEAQRLRWLVYGEEEKLLPASACRDGREIDARDRDPGTAHFIVRRSYQSGHFAAGINASIAAR